MQPKFINQRQVRDLVALSASQLNRLEARGQFPSRVRLTEHRVAWLLSEVREWQESKLRERSSDSAQ